MQTKSLLPHVWDVPQVFRERLGTKVGRQRSMVADGHLLLVLHQPPEPDEVERRGRFVWRQPDGAWTSSDQGSGPLVVNRHLDQFADVLQKYDELGENATVADEYFAVLEAVAPIHRTARHLHQVLQEARQALPEARDIINFRDRAYEIERTAELLYSETKNGLDFAVAKQAEEQAKASHRMAVSAHRLNVLAAFFFPLATLSAIFGVNMLHGFETTPPPIPFLTMLGAGLLSGIVLMMYITRKSD